MTKAAKNSDCAMRDCKLYKQSVIAHPYISPRMTESQDCVYVHNAMRDSFKQDMVNNRLYLRKYNHRVFCVSIITE